MDYQEGLTIGSRRQRNGVTGQNVAGRRAAQGRRTMLTSLKRRYSYSVIRGGVFAALRSA